MRALFSGFLVALLLVAGCDSSSDAVTDTVADGNVADAGPTDATMTPDSAVDATSPDDVVAVDLVDDTGTDGGADVPMVERHYTFRAVAGASMGAASAMIALRNPGVFDLVGPLGGYIDLPYLYHLMTTRMMNGFCPMQQILDNLEHINDPDWPDAFCGPAPTEHEWQHAVDYNHWYYTKNGGEFHRGFYLSALEDFLTAFGNLTSYSDVSPVVAQGITQEWFENPSCSEPARAEYPYNLNREYNPEGTYPLITFCDGPSTVGCTDDDPPLCGEQHPDFWELMGTYDPEQPHRTPFRWAMAVDYNDNGIRDYGEPLVYNAMERFQDVGTDGCGNDVEDGSGGCLEAARKVDPPDDPNGDDYDPLTNPTGTQGNTRYDEGEPYDDDGLDGVDAPEPSAVDYGEDNGQWDASPNFVAAMEKDTRHLIEQLPREALDQMDWWIDGGKRDMLESAVMTLNTAGALMSRGQEVRFYGGFIDRPDTVLPDTTAATFLTDLKSVDLSASAIGKNVHIAYGDPDATIDQIHLGNGGHVGDDQEIIQRLMLFFTWVGHRWPGIEPVVGGKLGPDLNKEITVYSDSLQARLRVMVNLPPGYLDEDLQDVRYPVVYFLHGHGMDPASALGAIAGLVQAAMAQGRVGKFILVMPEGWCCYRDNVTGLRECGCLQLTDAEPGHKACVDPTCTGPHDSCEIRQIPSSQLVRECHQGNFYQNLVADRWGSTEYVDVMRYGDAFLDLVHWVDDNYRTLPPADLMVPAPAAP